MKTGIECFNKVHWNKGWHENRALNASIRFIGTRDGMKTGIECFNKVHWNKG